MARSMTPTRTNDVLDAYEARLVLHEIERRDYSSTNPRHMTALAETVNLRYHGKRTPQQIIAFINHVREQDLTSEDFLD